MGLQSKKTSLSHLVIPAEAKYLPKIRDFAVKYAKKNGLSRKKLNSLRISIDEICSNIVLYAYEGMETGDIEVNIRKDDDRVIVEIIDSGIKLDYSTIEKPNLEKYVNEKKRGGLGFHLVKKLNDEVSYRRIGHQNVLTILTKVRESAESV
jgi:anti-sigma regulatory factor (Ser/Thr protein kinase)